MENAKSKKHEFLMQKIYEMLYRERFGLEIKDLYKTDHGAMTEMRVVLQDALENTGEDGEEVVVLTAAPFVDLESAEEATLTNGS